MGFFKFFYPAFCRFRFDLELIFLLKVFHSIPINFLEFHGTFKQKKMLKNELENLFRNKAKYLFLHEKNISYYPIRKCFALAYTIRTLKSCEKTSIYHVLSAIIAFFYNKCFKTFISIIGYITWFWVSCQNIFYLILMELNFE